MMIAESDLLGAFDKMSENRKNIIMEIVLLYHYRDGAKNKDGSLGRIEISPGELRDCLAYIFTFPRSRE